MPNWDEDSPQLRENLKDVLYEVAGLAINRKAPMVIYASEWQSAIMRGLTPPDPRFVGEFRGGKGLEGIEVRIGSHYGVSASKVQEELNRFESKLQQSVSALDGLIAPEQELNTDQLAAVLNLCAWVHAEWVRVHPLANGNGRTARLWANFIAMRYGLPPFIQLRPRPDTGYGEAGAKAMEGDWKSTVPVFQKLLDDFLKGHTPS